MSCEVSHIEVDIPGHGNVGLTVEDAALLIGNLIRGLDTLAVPALADALHDVPRVAWMVDWRLRQRRIAEARSPVNKDLKA